MSSLLHYFTYLKIGCHNQELESEKKASDQSLYKSQYLFTEHMHSASGEGLHPVHVVHFCHSPNDFVAYEVIEGK